MAPHQSGGRGTFMVGRKVAETKRCSTAGFTGTLYDLIAQNGTELNVNVDGLSRLPLSGRRAYRTLGRTHAAHMAPDAGTEDGR